jgi:ERCC4-type nuclease
MARPTPDPAFPVVVLIDTREQRPFGFDGITADQEHGGGFWQVRTEVRGIPSGDYSLDGFADRIAVERKSVADLFGTVGKGRGRFVRELERLAVMEWAAVVVEGDWTEVTERPPRRSKLPPRTVYRSVIAWQQRYPRVHWWFCPSRAFAEVTTFRLFERFLKEQAAK